MPPVRVGRWAAVPGDGTGALSGRLSGLAFKFESAGKASNSKPGSYHVRFRSIGQRMARIARAEYPAIQHLVDVEGRKVAEVAASYGCTPANIYAILGKACRSPGALDAPANPCSPLAQGLPERRCRRPRR